MRTSQWVGDVLCPEGQKVADKDTSSSAHRPCQHRPGHPTICCDNTACFSQQVEVTRDGLSEARVVQTDAGGDYSAWRLANLGFYFDNSPHTSDGRSQRAVEAEGLYNTNLGGLSSLIGQPVGQQCLVRHSRHKDPLRGPLDDRLPPGRTSKRASSGDTHTTRALRTWLRISTLYLYLNRSPRLISEWPASKSSPRLHSVIAPYLVVVGNRLQVF
ncbi:hypothetical protein Bbelb_329150 [Branchiostoma belcheri]|nr:hypothetical protein Bbelb_329150 [Branchiostoma belcheri]